jgi:hypothetical protein
MAAEVPVLGRNSSGMLPNSVPLEVLPNAVWPSDHLAIGAVLRLR